MITLNVNEENYAIKRQNGLRNFKKKLSNTFSTKDTL